VVFIESPFLTLIKACRRRKPSKKLTKSARCASRASPAFAGRRLKCERQSAIGRRGHAGSRTDFA
jgi:hypothetical protein